MKKNTDKIKPFKLVKYFTFTSLIVMFIGTLVLSAFNGYWIRTLLLKKSEAYALLLAENLNHQLFLQFVIPVALQYGKIQLRKKEQYERMDKVVRSTLHTFKVETVNIYDMNNIISYSFDPNVIGKINVGGAAYQSAVKGKSVSNLVQRGNFFEILMGFPKESRLSTYAPLRAERPLSVISGPILGVVEIVQDLTHEHQAIYDLQVLVIESSVAVMAILFLVLRYTVKRGEKIIQRRNEEQMQLKEQLQHARHLSSIGEMVATISHEIRNPLGIIQNSAELLKKKTQDIGPIRDIPEIIVQESGRLNNIISDFLSFAKPRLPALNLIQVVDVLENNLKQIESQPEFNQYLFTRDYDAHLPPIYADAGMLHQAFLNILLNAMQAMPEGGEIQVSVHHSEKKLSMQFHDQGMGIDKSVLDKIWDPFFTTKEKGTGLGLGIVKTIIDHHGGRIHISNRPSSGAAVIIELPVDRGTA